MFLHGRELKSLQLFGHAVPAKVHMRQPKDLDARSPFGACDPFLQPRQVGAYARKWESLVFGGCPPM